jgi:transglutaminase superfamily protein
MKNLFKFFHLSFAEKKVFFHALYLLVVYRIRLKISPIQDLFYRVQSNSRTIVPTISDPVSPGRIARLIAIASHFIPRSTCLSEALAGQILFASYGYKTRLHIGVAKDVENSFEAHAWLSFEEKILIGGLPDLQRFKELSTFPHHK